MAKFKDKLYFIVEKDSEGNWEYAKTQNNAEPDHNYPLIKESIEIINGGWDDMCFPVGCRDED